MLRWPPINKGCANASNKFAYLLLSIPDTIDPAKKIDKEHKHGTNIDYY